MGWLCAIRVRCSPVVEAATRPSGTVTETELRIASALAHSCPFVRLTWILSAQSSARPGADVTVQTDENVTMVTSEDLTSRFHPGRLLVRFRGESRGRVVPAMAPIEGVQQFRSDRPCFTPSSTHLVSIDATTPTDPLWAQQWDMANIAARQR
jgi:hypothetical protein